VNPKCRFGASRAAVSLTERQGHPPRISASAVRFRERTEIMATVNIEALSPDYENANSVLEVNRRLSDKVLAAFNHANAAGEADVAKQLRNVLKLTESKRVAGDKRITYSALEHADLWVGFVDARENYKSLADSKKATDLDSAMASMREAYRAWSDL
jgi:hypothetical protein